MHTPGPWTAKILPRRVMDVSSPSGVVVSWPGFDGSDVPVEEQEANARLIAAAPQLLTALAALVDSPNAKQNAMWDQARAALAAAQQEQATHAR